MQAPHQTDPRPSSAQRSACREDCAWTETGSRFLLLISLKILGTATAPIVGVVLNFAIWFAVHALFRQVRPVRHLALEFDASILASVDPWSLALSITAFIAVFRFKAEVITTLLACWTVGIALHPAGLIV